MSMYCKINDVGILEVVLLFSWHLKQLEQRILTESLFS